MLIAVGVSVQYENMADLTKIKKRDGRIVKFNKAKITRVIVAALTASSEVVGDNKQKKEAQRLTEIVVNILNSNDDSFPTVEQVQDIVEQVLMAAGYYLTAKGYILYREERRVIRDVRGLMGVRDDIGLSLNQLRVLENRYLRHDQYGRVIETPRQLFERVAKSIARQEKKGKRRWWEKRFFEVMSRLEFVPSGCYLRSAGTKNPMLANCFVLPVKDDLGAIFDAVKWQALIQGSGGGTGFDFSQLRPRGDYITSSGGLASGPVSFMKVFDAATSQVMQGGYRRGANMGVLRVDHPDIMEFITCKTEKGEITNFNISVGITDVFMEAVKKRKSIDLKNPRTGKKTQKIDARRLFSQIVTLAWQRGDPGVIFLDTINRNNPVKKRLGLIAATNVCGEQPLHSFDVCNLGSINLTKFIGDSGADIDWKKLEKVVKIAVRFLDNGVDVSQYPIPQITKMAKGNRRIGLGVMGWANMLYQLRIGYDSDKAVELGRKIMKFVNNIAIKESKKLAEEKGVFKYWQGSLFEKRGIKRRNLAVTTIAPNGTISMVADCSSGIEPVFALSYVKNVVSEQGLSYVNSYFKKAVENSNLTENQKNDVYKKVVETGSCQDIEYLPSAIKKVFVTAHDIDFESHVKMQAGFQKHTENAVSKTINLPQSATIDDVEKAYLLAWQLGCKGITIYRSGSREGQILSRKKSQGEGLVQSKLKVEPLAAKRLCPECGSIMEVSSGCAVCKQCGFSKCSL